MIEVCNFELDDETGALVELFSKKWMLPKTAVPTLAIQEVIVQEDPEFVKQLKTGEEYLLHIADRFEKNPPKTKKEKHEFAEILRYAAQFMTTRLIHAAPFEDERPAKNEATA
ncbi:hypothetical protein [Mesorhizobium sp. SP-1A]|uniref:hypothetical protein n=1 Tax=Mesorhizobium sp. SP-1A TaxID=3077840 RepID=UPI0028F6DC66|nr:hypothetical protein [Mesorhizobium sp. SP-1A]